MSIGEPAAVATSPAKSGPGFYAVMAVLLLIEIVSAIETTMVYAILPAVAREYGDVTTATWLITAFGLAVAATAAIGGSLGDRFGRRRVLFWVVLLTGCGSLISAFGRDLETVILGRVVQGASGAILPLCYGITRDLAPKGKAAFWIGLLAGGYIFTSALGLVLGGYFADRGHWTSIFLLTAAMSLSAVPLILLVVPRLPTAGSARHLDFVGAVLFAPAIAAVLYGLTEGAKLGWGAQVAAYVGGGLAMLAFWVWYEARHHNPLIDVRFMLRRNIAIGNLCTLMANAGTMLISVVTQLLYQQDPRLSGIGFGLSATTAGLWFLPCSVTALIGSVLAGWMAGAYGARIAILLGGLICAASWTGLILFHDTLAQAVVLSMLVTFGNGLLIAALPNIILESTPRDRSSEATGVMTVVRAVGRAVGAQVVGIILASSYVLHAGGRAPTETAYVYAFTVIAVAALLVVVMAQLASRERGEV